MLTDQQGSVVALAHGSNGSVFAHNSYGPYGEPAAGNWGRYQHSGQQWYGRAGLSYMRNRWYHPELGRFMSADPIGYQGGMNLYAYTSNDPLNRWDPWGLCGADICVMAERRPPVLRGETLVVNSAIGRIRAAVPILQGRYEPIVVTACGPGAESEEACQQAQPPTCLSGQVIFAGVTGTLIIGAGLSMSIGEFETTNGARGIYGIVGGANQFEEGAGGGFDVGLSAELGYAPDVDTFFGRSTTISTAIGPFSVTTNLPSGRLLPTSGSVGVGLGAIGSIQATETFLLAITRCSNI